MEQKVSEVLLILSGGCSSVCFLCCCVSFQVWQLSSTRCHHIYTSETVKMLVTSLLHIFHIDLIKAGFVICTLSSLAVLRFLCCIEHIWKEILVYFTSNKLIHWPRKLLETFLWTPPERFSVWYPAENKFTEIDALLIISLRLVVFKCLSASDTILFIIKMQHTSSYPHLQLAVMTHGMTDAWTHGSPDLSPPSWKQDHIIFFKSSGVSSIFTVTDTQCSITKGLDEYLSYDFMVYSDCKILSKNKLVFFISWLNDKIKTNIYYRHLF